MEPHRDDPSGLVDRALDQQHAIEGEARVRKIGLRVDDHVSAIAVRSSNPACTSRSSIPCPRPGCGKLRG